MQSVQRKIQKMGRYDHLKAKKENRRSKRKKVQEIIIVLLIALAIAGFIVQIVTQTKN